MGSVDKLFSLFNDEAVSWHAAKAIGEIGSGGGDILTKRNFAVLRVSGDVLRRCEHVNDVWHLQLLFAQKFFNVVAPRIVKGYDATTGECDFVIVYPSSDQEQMHDTRPHTLSASLR